MIIKITQKLITSNELGNDILILMTKRIVSEHILMNQSEIAKGKTSKTFFQYLQFTGLT